jgi:predicted GNAT family acetyltransferase
VADSAVLHEQTGSRGAFYVERDGKRLAEMTYSVAGETRIIIDHTDVSDLLRGTGTGGKLVAAAVEWARKQNKKILPLCPFAKSVFDKTSSYKDVLA